MFHTHVVSVCSKCFICFRHMLHSSVLCCKCFCVSEVWSESLGVMALARSAPGVLWTGCARPHPGSRVPPMRREKRGSREGVVAVGRGEADGGPIHVRGRTRWTGIDVRVQQRTTQR
jgi:hypothetical protein